jgi:hypothetical protein
MVNVLAWLIECALAVGALYLAWRAVRALERIAER